MQLRRRSFIAIPPQTSLFAPSSAAFVPSIIPHLSVVPLHEFLPPYRQVNPRGINLALIPKKLMNKERQRDKEHNRGINSGAPLFQVQS
ncbi:UNVERIFIED_CONTAM: hypothetical protein Sradi_2536000 [Sesamum radiatum]|uniref:Uncharacterized protein n=1 Tax=Sesamum radiatum TaxID=300843 RepID=A0AAW2SLJ3_SESRA